MSSAELARAPTLAPSELEDLERRLSCAFASGDESELDVLGYGEISCVVGWSSGDRRYACKRLPTFDSEARVERYRELFARYVASLERAGIATLPSTLVAVPCAKGTAVYCVQPRLSPAALLSRAMREAPRARAIALFEALLDRILGAVRPSLGLDAQLSNWVVRGDRLFYLDLTTPMLRDEGGRDELDADLFLASLPWALRGVVKRTMMHAIMDKYFDPRGALLDVLGNLHKERLLDLVPPFLDAASARFPEHPLDAEEVRRYYESDARMWSLLQRLRRMDRAWQRGVRRRPYPFLLPGAIER